MVRASPWAASRTGVICNDHSSCHFWPGQTPDISNGPSSVPTISLLYRAQPSICPQRRVISRHRPLGQCQRGRAGADSNVCSWRWEGNPSTAQQSVWGHLFAPHPALSRIQRKVPSGARGRASPEVRQSSLSIIQKSSSEVVIGKEAVLIC